MHERATTMKDRRKKEERRNFSSKEKCQDKHDRRYSPDRRLNSISAEWVPINHVRLHPVTRVVFSRD